jgi:hypothetical protein
VLELDDDPEGILFQRVRTRLSAPARPSMSSRNISAWPVCWAVSATIRMSSTPKFLSRLSSGQCHPPWALQVKIRDGLVAVCTGSLVEPNQVLTGLVWFRPHERLFERQPVRRLGTKVHWMALRKLRILDAAMSLADLRAPPPQPLGAAAGRPRRAAQHSDQRSMAHLLSMASGRCVRRGDR